MSFFRKLFGFSVPSTEAPPRTISDRDREKADFHVRRFQRAIEQCEKGDARRAELANHLAYWKAVAAAVALRPE